MLRGALQWLAARVRGDGGADDGGADGSRFVPSRLDASVRFAHGGSSADVEREIADIEADARTLEEGRPDD